MHIDTGHLIFPEQFAFRIVLLRLGVELIPFRNGSGFLDQGKCRETGKYSQ